MDKLWLTYAMNGQIMEGVHHEWTYYGLGIRHEWTYYGRRTP